jgi:hypothetical protein
MDKQGAVFHIFQVNLKEAIKEESIHLSVSFGTGPIAVQANEPLVPLGVFCLRNHYFYRVQK